MKGELFGQPPAFIVGGTLQRALAIMFIISSKRHAGMFST